jgi:hypothetical protein
MWQPLLHAENLGGDIELMLGQRALIGAFPGRYDGLEGRPCRVVAFLDFGEDVEAVGDAARAIIGVSGGCAEQLPGAAIVAS